MSAAHGPCSLTNRNLLSGSTARTSKLDIVQARGLGNLIVQSRHHSGPHSFTDVDDQVSDLAVEVGLAESQRLSRVAKPSTDKTCRVDVVFVIAAILADLPVPPIPVGRQNPRPTVEKRPGGFQGWWIVRLR